eukprot:TRINITY_DN4593_c0_g1_i1.p2 TRINITY_DN4593_c0_g1~~TRINITY_DN4593_c0_g1_i1.p2  ORF type:complete len:145 (-),score=16.57 TRINITY_DN4593_c0_g1_i1:149-583(-)
MIALEINHGLGLVCGLISINPLRPSKTFEVDSFNPNFTKYPLLAHVPVYECTLMPGEVLFVPANTPHQVMNLEDSIAISMNYIDASNYFTALNEIGMEGETGDESMMLLFNLLREVDVRSNMRLQNTEWNSFKSRWRDAAKDEL